MNYKAMSLATFQSSTKSSKKGHLKLFLKRVITYCFKGMFLKACNVSGMNFIIEALSLNKQTNPAMFSVPKALSRL